MKSRRNGGESRLVEDLDEEDIRVGWVGDLKEEVMEHCDEMIGQEVEVSW